MLGVAVGKKAMWAHRAGTLAFSLLALVVALSIGVLLEAKPAHAKTFTVNSTGDGADVALDGNCDADPRAFVNVCTLRAAIEEANNRIQNPGADTIMFSIPPTTGANCNATTGVCTISPASPLPHITEAVTLDGNTQRPCSNNPAPCSRPNTKAAGTNANLLIQLNGGNCNCDGGLRVKASNSVVKGLVINRFLGDGIAVGSATNDDDVFVSNTRVEGNFIGTNPAGTADLGNSEQGVYIEFGSEDTVGGTSLAVRNLISGNGEYGIWTEVSGTKVLGNLIGTDRTGTKALGNDLHGVFLDSSFETVGGETAASANVIAFNGQDGVAVDDSRGSAILRNSIFANGKLGIDLGDNGRTANDVGDADSGVNNHQNFPVISSAETVGTVTTINARLNSTPFTGFVVRFFSNPSNDNEGKRYLGQMSVQTDENGNTGAFTFSPEQRVGLGQRITATATDPAGNTSEFSAPREVSGGVIGEP
jgi:CSLREA domain-containing protein